MMGPLKILYFAWVRERVGAAEEALALPPGVADVAGLIDWLRGRSPGHASAFAQLGSGPVRVAVNQVLAHPHTPVAAGDEIAFFPPVTGG